MLKSECRQGTPFPFSVQRFWLRAAINCAASSKSAL
jgi:hypothetical protein